MEATVSLFLFIHFRIFEITLIFLDIYLVAIDLHLNKNIFYIPLEYSSVSFAIAFFPCGCSSLSIYKRVTVILLIFFGE